VLPRIPLHEAPPLFFSLENTTSLIFIWIIWITWINWIKSRR